MKSLIEQELEGKESGLDSNYSMKDILSAIKKVREELMKKRVCESRVGLHVCEKHPDNCYFMVEWEDIEKVMGK